MSDPQIGVRVWRIEHHGMPSVVVPRSYLDTPEHVEGFRTREPSKVGVTHTITPGVWISLDPEEIKRVRETIEDIVENVGDISDCADAVLAALGLVAG